MKRSTPGSRSPNQRPKGRDPIHTHYCKAKLSKYQVPTRYVGFLGLGLVPYEDSHVASKCLWALEFGTHRLQSEIALIPESALQLVRQIPLADPTVIICLGLGFRDPLFGDLIPDPKLARLPLSPRSAAAVAQSLPLRLLPSLHLQILLRLLLFLLLSRLLCASAFEIRRESGARLFVFLSWRCCRGWSRRQALVVLFPEHSGGGV